MIQVGMKNAGNTELYCSRLVCHTTTTLSFTCLPIVFACNLNPTLTCLVLFSRDSAQTTEEGGSLQE